MSTPQHVAIIMDGNRRWAKQHGLDALVGHQKMVREGIEKVVAGARDLGIQYLTLWAFSTENWNREKREVEALMALFREVFSHQAERLHKENVRIKTIGDLTRFAPDIQENIKKWVDISNKNTGITVIFAINYGGRDEILRAVEKISNEVKNGKRTPEKMTTEEFDSYLDTADIPDPDLIIRPGGEKRLSGYLLWQSEYAELYFTDVLMPDFDEKELKKAVAEYESRQRRFGK